MDIDWAIPAALCRLGYLSKEAKVARLPTRMLLNSQPSLHDIANMQWTVGEK